MFFLGIIFLVITVIGLIGNTTVLIVIAANKQMHDSTNILICNLAIADLLFLIFCAPLTAYAYVYSWNFSETICYVTVTLQYVTCYVSVWSLMLLALDRYLSITSPGKSRGIRRGNSVFCVCVSAWLILFALNFPQMRNVGVLRFEYNGTMGMTCVDSMEIAMETSTVLGARIFYWGFNIGAFLLPLSLSTILYILLVKSLWKEKLVHSKSSTKMKKHATKMVFTVIVTFALCWFPQNLRFFLRGLNYPDLTFWEQDTDLLLAVQSTAQVLAYANSCVNPILYGVLSERFRAGLLRVWNRFGCLCRKYAGKDHYYHSPMGRSLCDSQNISRMPSEIYRTRSTKLLTPDQHSIAEQK
ncbi:Protein NPR-9 [Aphelenchoides avenae]|nr:Protein NPR-9 [Aphelenchus avenae]